MLFTHGRKAAACAALIVLATTGIVACGGDDDDDSASPTLCDDSQALQSSVEDLKDVNVVENGTSSLTDRGDQGAGTTRRRSSTAAKDEFQPEVEDLQTALSTLATSVTQIVSDGIEPVQDAVTGVEDAASEPHRQDRRRAVRLTA